MRACWMLLILMGYKLSHASQSTCPCNDKWKTVCVPAGDSVPVPCPELTGEDVTFRLFKNGHIYHTCMHENNFKNCTNTRADVELHENEETKLASFMLTGVNASNHGIYSCEVMVTFPPPFKKQTSVMKILVSVEGHQCKVSRAPEGQGSGFPWVWAVALALVCSYSIIVTIVACVTWAKMRRVDSQSDYMNTKPRAPRKKRGVQNPVPRYF